MSESERERLHFLDGIRGWGAIAVVLFHIFVEAFPINERTTAVLRHVFMFNGVLAVWVFFLVSGFSLSIAYCRRRDDRVLVTIGLGRYVRLAVPILAAVLLLYLLFVLGAVLPVDQRLPKFQGVLPTGPSLWEVLRFSLFDVFFRFDATTTLIGPLWTMPFELWGSCLVLGTLFVVGRLERRFYVIGVLAAVSFLIHPIYAAFVVGLLLAELFSSAFWRGRGAKLSTAAILLALLGVCAASLLPNEANVHHGAYFAVAFLLTVGCIFSRPLSDLLSRPVSRFLGRISFPLYLIHGPLMLVYSNAVYHWAVPTSDMKRLLLNLSTLAVCIGCATLMVPIDRLGIGVAKSIGRYVVSRGKGAVTRIEKSDVLGTDRSSTR
jgi:peptidoglycan/LPS O-acetylase OafA/YrhL